MLRRDERGSFAPMTALLLTVIVGFTAFAVDLGLQRAAARDMQAVADTVALDTARDPNLSACNNAALTAVANRSFDRRSVDPIGTTDDLVATAGHLNAEGVFEAGTGSSGCDAVEVSATTEVGYAFAPVIGTDSGSATRTAVGTRSEPAVCFSAGTRALVLNTSESALGPLLDYILRVELGAVGYDGLVDLKNLSVPLADLAVELGVGSVQELVEAEVSLFNFMIAVADVLPTAGNAVTIELLRTVAAGIDDLSLRVGDILELGTGEDAGLDLDVNALDLLGAAIVAANGSNGLAVEGLGLDLGPLLSSGISLSIIEPPQIACGAPGPETVARTAQVRLNVVTRLLGIDGIRSVSAARVSLGVDVASGAATLSGLSCSTPESATIIPRTSVVGITGADGEDRATVTALGIADLALVRINLSGGVGGTQHAPATFTYPDEGLPAAQTFGSAVGLSLSVSGTQVLGLPLGWLLDGIVSPLVSVVGSALNAVLTPVLSLLGIRIGTMDVSMLGAPSCSGVRLAG